ncbi:AMP-binding protein [Micromonospora sp. M12]
MVFTSGSTGAPKGVPIRHRNVAHWLPYVLDYFEAGPDVRVSQTSDLAWDLSVWNVFLPWAAGGALVVPERTELLAPRQHINDDGITHWFSTRPPSSPRGCSVTWSPARCPGCGGASSVASRSPWTRPAPGGRSPEQRDRERLRSDRDDSHLPHLLRADEPGHWPGKRSAPCRWGRRTRRWRALMDEEGRPADEGELLIRGPQRFDGYLDPADDVGRFTRWQGDRWSMREGEPLTAEHWFRTGDRVRHGDHGYVFLGRMDNQVKVNGYRIETGEIESVLREHEAVDEAAVVPWQAEDGTVELAAFYVGDRARQDDLERFLGEQLPGYMIPPRLCWIERFPLNVNGKIDRRQLVEWALTAIDV